MEAAGSVQFFGLKDIFPVGSQVYILAHPYYGCQAEVINHAENRVRVKVNQLAEPNLRQAMEYKVGSWLCTAVRSLINANERSNIFYYL